MKARKLTHDEASARTLEVADMILGGMSTAEVAKYYGYASRSSVTNMIERNLLLIDKEKYDKVKEAMHEHVINNGKKNGSLKKITPERVKLAQDVADYIIETNCTYAMAERHFGLKSGAVGTLVHKVLKSHNSTKFIELQTAIKRRKHPVGSFVAPKFPDDIELEFVKGGDISHNSIVVYNYIMKKECSYVEAAKHFEISKNIAKRMAEHGCNLKNGNQKNLSKIALRGNYTGKDSLVETHYGQTLAEYKAADKENSHMICDYILQNDGIIKEVSEFFNINTNNIARYVDLMAEIDYDKYYAVKKCQRSRSANTKILPNPNTSVKSEQPSNNVVQMIVPDTAPLSSPTLVAEPVKVAASAEPIVKDTDVPVIEKVCETKIEMVAKPAVEDVKAPKIGIFQKIKNWFMGA
jgi:transposase